jgi:hypothetical protein
MCPNLRPKEWLWLHATHPDLFALAVEIETRAALAGNLGEGLHWPGLRNMDFMLKHQQTIFDLPGVVTDDRCHHGGCFT